MYRELSVDIGDGGRRSHVVNGSSQNTLAGVRRVAIYGVLLRFRFRLLLLLLFCLPVTQYIKVIVLFPSTNSVVALTVILILGREALLVQP